MKIVVVGGVAGGASAAARARRLCESCEIIVFDRGEHVSFANCGLPYFVGDVIHEEADLLLATPKLFADRFNIDVRTRSEVTRIDRETSRVEVRDLPSGDTYLETYDALILSPGAKPVRPELSGIDLPGIFQLRTIPDSKRIKKAAEGASRVVIVGAGFIGIEMAENFHQLGLHVTLLEKADQVLPPFDPELAILVRQRLEENNIEVLTDTGVTGFRKDSQLQVDLENGGTLPADLVLLAIGVRPEATLAAEAGLTIGKRGGIGVDAYMRTSDPNIWAVGDAVEVHDLLTDNWKLIPLAGPANRQGRIAAENAIGRDGDHEIVEFRGVQGTAIAGVFGLAAAATGASEKTLLREGMSEFGKVYLHPAHHVGYYPGAKSMSLKLLYSMEDGRVLGAQAVGEEGAARRIDVIATTIQHGGTVWDLAEAELAYAPQYGAAKDPVNLAGMIAVNNLQGDLPLAEWQSLAGDRDDTAFSVVDVRSPREFSAGHVDGALNIPVDELRERLDELPDEKLLLLCEVGKRAYYATRMLRQLGYDAENLSGGMKTWRALRASGALST